LLTESLSGFQRILVPREKTFENARKADRLALSFRVEKTVQRFSGFAEADKADRDFYKKLTGNQRLQILVELSKHEPEQRLERVYRIIKLPRR
jgi:hypothetical protein